MPIQPKKLFHSDITHEATTPPNGQPHARVGTVLPKWWTLVAFEPTPSMMLTDSQAAVAAYIFSDTLDPSEELVINLVALMMTRVFQRRNEDPICWFMPTHFAVKLSL
ncbi:uncharacterized protein DS421_19g664220 [Arachis hypogaea]|uniref:Uncharacterized protein n=1 Tax=Arachis hypogaea TaxID=3818 RepID=A0A6B9VAA8_ARAHY|nr:uncharacterized protein DS421_19g664220 [Arachis hypogaea]